MGWKNSQKSKYGGITRSLPGNSPITHIWDLKKLSYPGSLQPSHHEAHERLRWKLERGMVYENHQYHDLGWTFAIVQHLRPWPCLCKIKKVFNCHDALGLELQTGAIGQANLGTVLEEQDNLGSCEDHVCKQRATIAMWFAGVPMQRWQDFAFGSSAFVHQSNSILMMVQYCYLAAKLSLSYCGWIGLFSHSAEKSLSVLATSPRVNHSKHKWPFSQGMYNQYSPFKD